MQKITSYLSAQKFLEDFYSQRKKKDPAFTFEKWAVELGYESRSFLKMIASGKRRVTPEFIKVFSDKNGLSADETEYFNLLTLHDQSDSEKQREIYMDKIMEFRYRYRKVRVIGDHDKFLKNTCLPLLQTLLSFKDIDRSVPVLAGFLNISHSELMDLLQSLVENGSVEKIGDEWKSRDDSFYVPKKFDSEALKQYHNTSLQEAMNAQDLPVHLRRFRSLLLPLNETEFQEILNDLQGLVSKVLTKYDRDELAGRRVYKVNFNLFPMTEAHIASSQA